MRSGAAQAAKTLHWEILAENIQVSVFCVKLDLEAPYVSFALDLRPLAEHIRKPHQYGRPLPDHLQELGSAVRSDIVCHLEESVRPP